MHVTNHVSRRHHHRCRCFSCSNDTSGNIYVHISKYICVHGLLYTCIYVYYVAMLSPTNLWLFPFTWIHSKIKIVTVYIQQFYICEHISNLYEAKCIIYFCGRCVLHYNQCRNKKKKIMLLIRQGMHVSDMSQYFINESL